MGFRPAPPLHSPPPHPPTHIHRGRAKAAGLWRELLLTPDAGWARLRGKTYKAAVSLGWNPFYGNTHKTLEPWLLAEFSEVRRDALRREAAVQRAAPTRRCAARAVRGAAMRTRAARRPLGNCVWTARQA